MNPLLWFVPGGNVVQALGTAGTALIKFVTSTAGMVAIAAAVFYGLGHHQASKACKAAAIQAQLEATKEDLTYAQISASVAEEQADAIESDDKANQGKINALAEDLKAAKARVVTVPGKDRVVYSCGLSGDNARRLRDIK